MMSNIDSRLFCLSLATALALSIILANISSHTYSISAQLQEPIQGTLTPTNATTFSSNGTAKNMSLYENKEQGYKIKYPSEWQVAQMPDSASRVVTTGGGIAFTPYSGPIQGLTEPPPGGAVMVGVIPNPPAFPYITPENYTIFLNLMMADIKADPEGFAERFGRMSITNPELVSISNYSMISFAGKQQDGPFAMDAYMLPLYGNFYILGVIDTKTDSEFLPVAGEMLNSFEVTEPVQASFDTTDMISEDTQLSNETTRETRSVSGMETDRQLQRQQQAAPMLDDTGTANVTGTQDIESARELLLETWDNSEFNSNFDTFIQREQFEETGYGIYNERSNVFEPGQSIHLYLEPVGFSHREVFDREGNILYFINMTADIIISDDQGNQLFSIEDIDVYQVTSHNKVTEVALILTADQPRPPEGEPFPEGDYVITYVITDGNTGEIFELAKDIRIAQIFRP